MPSRNANWGEPFLLAAAANCDGEAEQQTKGEGAEMVTAMVKKISVVVPLCRCICHICLLCGL